MASKTEDFNEEVESLKDKAKKNHRKSPRRIFGTRIRF